MMVVMTHHGFRRRRQPVTRDDESKQNDLSPEPSGTCLMNYPTLAVQTKDTIPRTTCLGQNES